MKALLMLIAILGASALYATTDSDKVVGEFEEAAEKVGNKVKQGVRAVKDSTCELHSSKVECAAEKAKHKVQTAVEDVTEEMN
tara:strand:+ start:13145 stop:13393 length:249 start_codon:yes stop_codon:yes gene_type:complete